MKGVHREGIQQEKLNIFMSNCKKKKKKRFYVVKYCECFSPLEIVEEAASFPEGRMQQRCICEVKTQTKPLLNTVCSFSRQIRVDNLSVDW